MAWLAHSQTGSEFGCSRRAILVEPQQTGWHSWQSGGWQKSEADIKGSEYTRLRCSGLDRLVWLALCCGDWKSGGGKVAHYKVTWHPPGLQQQEERCMLTYAFNCTVCLFVYKCVFMNVHVCSVHLFLHHGRVLLTIVYRVCIH